MHDARSPRLTSQQLTFPFTNMIHHLKKIKSRLLRIALIVLGSLLLFLILVIAFISPIAKHIIEKNGEKYMGAK